MKKLGINTALIITTNNEYLFNHFYLFGEIFLIINRYGGEFDDMIYNVETIKLNISFYQVTIDTNASDFDQKVYFIHSFN